jgi:hypothetical protein
MTTNLQRGRDMLLQSPALDFPWVHELDFSPMCLIFAYAMLIQSIASIHRTLAYRRMFLPIPPRSTPTVISLLPRVHAIEGGTRA